MKNMSTVKRDSCKLYLNLTKQENKFREANDLTDGELSFLEEKLRWLSSIAAQM